MGNPHSHTFWLIHLQECPMTFTIIRNGWIKDLIYLFVHLFIAEEILLKQRTNGKNYKRKSISLKIVGNLQPCKNIAFWFYGSVAWLKKIYTIRAKYIELCRPSYPSYLSVSALLWLSRAACRSFSSLLFSDSIFSASLGARLHGLAYCSSFRSSSFSLMRIRRSLSGSRRPGHASLSSLAIWTSIFAILMAAKWIRQCKGAVVA